MFVASTINDGTYIWAGNYDDWLQGYGSGPYPSSGCNYTIEISAGGQRALSEYFTVQNDDDGGLNTTVECPTGSPDITDGNVATNTNYNGNGGTQSCGYSAATLGGAIAGVGAFFLTLFAATFVIGLKGGWIIFGIRRRKRGYDAAGNGENDMRADSLTKGATVEQNEVRNAGDEMNEYMRLYRKYGDAQMVGGMPLYQMPGNRDGS